MNYFNRLTFRKKIKQLGQCRFIPINEFRDGISSLKEKKIVIIGCGAQGLNQGLNMRDSGLNVAYVLRSESIRKKEASWKRVIENGLTVGSYEELVPQADLVINLTPDKQHISVVSILQSLMKKGATLGYSHGFHIVEVGETIRSDITVIMMAPKCPGTELREEYQKGFGVPTLIAVHPDNDPYNEGMAIAKAWAFATGGHRAGVLASSFVAEVKSDLMGEQTILCGILQSASIVFYKKMILDGIDPGYAGKFLQYGWETLTKALKEGGITLMMDRLSNTAKLRAFNLSLQLKNVMRPLFEKNMDKILDGTFSIEMMRDWETGDTQLLSWRRQVSLSDFEKAPLYQGEISEQEYFDHGILLIAIIKAGVELAFEVMVSTGLRPESAYYESLHELPLIANTLARNRLYEMNRVISDTAEYGSYLFSHILIPILEEFCRENVNEGDIGNNTKFYIENSSIDNTRLKDMNKKIRSHPIEIIGEKLRESMRYENQ
ncbi:ketol-acid reductoisomerase [Candidatus Schneideria nysicola]|uniref:ketol-acid reductoisomerase n=1 Tax=Candidatus Schneideria nysicola TaxID=1081631 RepID=UPI001CAA4A90|nr:ketol-acid reductoisomerase [Candidatus Schneideria nysicola]UAJ66266.1 ketol-acid reductoisomerase [Candidatus Schneideria nysicola]